MTERVVRRVVTEEWIEGGPADEADLDAGSDADDDECGDDEEDEE